MNPPPHNPYDPNNPFDPNNPYANPGQNQPPPPGYNQNPNPNQNWQQNPWQQNPYQQPPQQFPPYNPFIPGGQLDLPNATGVLVLGIISILGAFCYGFVGVILGIIALVMSSKGKELYEANPAMYTASSFNNMKAGRICGIIGLSMGGLFIVSIVIAVLADM